MNKTDLLPFTIDSIDTLGQGVCRSNGKVTFIAKTLPGDRGLARVVSSKKSWQTAEVIELQHSSELQIKPACPHFSFCGGCHFLHTNYENEIKFKTQSIVDQFKRAKISINQITTINSPERFHTRNRVQLHYDFEQKVFGLHKIRSHEIIPIQSCLLPNKQISEFLQQLYQNPSELWLHVQKTGKKQGLFEISQISHDQPVTLTIDQGRSVGGFTQVNPAMNHQLQQVVKRLVENNKTQHLVDLFGGSGNLTKELKTAVTVVDYRVNQTKLGPHQSKMEGDLYRKNFVEQQLLPQIKKLPHPLGIIIDPPRSGWTFLAEFIKKTNPEFIVMVSCHPQNLMRDLLSVKKLKFVPEVVMLDMFPSTYHFETVAYIPQAAWI